MCERMRLHSHNPFHDTTQLFLPTHPLRRIAPFTNMTVVSAVLLPIAQVRVPPMCWYQTKEHVHLCITVPTKVPATNTILVDISSQRFVFSARSTEKHVHYEVNADWFQAVDAEHSSWSVSSDEDGVCEKRVVLVTVCKQRMHAKDRCSSDTCETKEGTTKVTAFEMARHSHTAVVQQNWTHPFSDKAYKPFVRVDWARWRELPSDSDTDWTDDDNDDDTPGLGPVTPSNLSEFTRLSSGARGGDEHSSVEHTEAKLPNEQDPEFKQMLASLQRLGEHSRDGNTADHLPSVEELMRRPRMDNKALQTLLGSVPCNNTDTSAVDVEPLSGVVALDNMNLPLKELHDEPDERSSIDSSTDNDEPSYQSFERTEEADVTTDGLVDVKSTSADVGVR